MRAVLDPNVLVSAAISASGAPAQVVRRWLEGEFELVASPLLLEELSRVLAYPKIAERVAADDAAAMLELVAAEAEVAVDGSGPAPVNVEDPGDEYLVVLAVATGAALVSGDGHLTVLADRLPIYRPAEFLRLLDDPRESSSRRG